MAPIPSSPHPLRSHSWLTLAGALTRELCEDQSRRAGPRDPSR